MTDPWYDGAVLYQVYPRSFADANGDGIGDLPGVAAHLDHVGPGGLGVDAIWLSPFYPHGGVDGGYDVTDHVAVASEYGRLADVDRILANAHRLGLRVILDLVVGHTSDRHPWFIASRASRTDPKRDWYLWADGRSGGAPPSNWVAEFGGSAWTPDATSGQWFHHSFFPEQPDLNWRSTAVRRAIADVMRFWLGRGADGFRLDAMQYLLKDPQLRDNPPATRVLEPWGAEPGGLRRRRTRDQRGVAGIVRGLRQVSDEYPDTVLLGELYGPADRVAAAFGGTRGGGVHLALDHQLAKSAWDAVAFRRAIAAAERHLPAPRAPTWAFSNHDISRHATRWGPSRARLAALILLTLRGTVSLYQGEELEMEDVPPAAPWSTDDRAGRDPARSPMDWARVKQQRNDPQSLLALYRSLIALRRRSPALRRGTLTLSRDFPRGVLAYERAAGRERLLIVANMGQSAVRVPLPAGIERRPVAVTVEDLAVDGDHLLLAPDEGVVLRLG